MNKIIHVVVLVAATIMFSACNKKETASTIITTRKPAKSVKKEIQQVGDYMQSRMIDWNGTVCTVVVERKADKSMPLIDDGVGNKYYDNKIAVRITGKEGQDLFSHVFTKADFANYVDCDYIQRSALLGVVFDRIEGRKLFFAASVGSPDKMSDDFVPLVVSLKYGSRQPDICNDNVLDTDTGEKNDEQLEQKEMEGI